MDDKNKIMNEINTVSSHIKNLMQMMEKNGMQSMKSELGRVDQTIKTLKDKVTGMTKM